MGMVNSRRQEELLRLGRPFSDHPKAEFQTLLERAEAL